MGGDATDEPVAAPPPVLSLTDAGHGDSQAARMVAAIVTYAINSRASDIHVCCTDAGAEVRIRIDGVLHAYTRIHGANAAASMIGRIKVLGGLDLGQRRLPQDGRIHVVVEGRSVDIRLATIPNVWNAEDAVLRILDASIGVVSVESLGMHEVARAAWARLSQSPYGLILVAGPTGCGKSTTLYATLREIATPDRAVRTVEDPVEVRLPGITQVQVNPRAGLTFASALRSFLRADPDVILVGEIRDHETARVATEAAVTGHLVLATVHTASASQVPVRLVEMGVPAYLVSAALRGAMAQRLVRRLCRDCRVRGPAGAWSPDALPVPSEVAEASPKGCARCAHTGYRGRVAAAEVMVVDEDIQRAIADGVPVENMTKLAVEAGMLPLRHAILDLVRAGDTSLSELTRVTSSGFE
jgi:type IV pilus assembly protein PilB